ncbi:cytochrome c-type biogenesis protein [Hyphococcus sp.]|uniref:cytochrome c-type biogenesis protein n=1 Tax=Hyphococcus sp. TaxID=2038636 RepID=UPI003CCB7EAE
MKLPLILLIFMLAAAVVAGSAEAAEPDEVLSDPVMEERARELDEKLRCVVCQSQSLAESNAPLAKDMRILVRERISVGDSDEEVIQYLVDRYGDYVLLMPRVQRNTIFLWLFPVFVVASGGVVALIYLRSLKKPVAFELSDEDEEEIERIIYERSQ